LHARQEVSSWDGEFLVRKGENYPHKGGSFYEKAGEFLHKEMSWKEKGS
jgi:hypothetical protein